MRKLLKRKNMGFTIVELIVTIAIISIVGGAIASFLLISQRQYNNGVAESSVQYDAQLVGNQIHDLLIDAQRGVSYGYVSELADGTTQSGLVLNNSTIGDYDSLELYIYNKDKYYRMRWDKDEKRVYFAEAAPGVVVNESMEALLAEFVTDFSVDLSELLSKKTVSYSIKFLKAESGREYTVSHSVKLRNDILVNATSDELYIPDAPEVVATGIDVYPPRVYIWPGGSAKLASKVTSNVGLMPSQEVHWLFAEHPSGDSPITDTTTGFSDATLFLGLKEEGRILDGEPHRINVYAKQDATSLISDNVAVGVRTITDMNAVAYLEGMDKSFASDRLTVNAGQENICVELKGFSGYYLEDLCLGNMEETISNMGGISVLVDGTYLEMTSSMEEAKRTGKLWLKVKNGIDFGENATVDATVTFVCDRYEVTDARYVSETVTVTIRKDDRESPIEVPDGGWKRNGLLKIDLSKVDVQVADGSLLTMYMKLAGLDENGVPKAHEHTFVYSNEGAYVTSRVNPEYPEYRYQPQDGNPFEMLFSISNGNDVQLYLKSENTSGGDMYSFSENFYNQYGSQSGLSVCGAWIWFTYGDYDSREVDGEQGKYVPISPVTFRYSMDGVVQSVWDTRGAMTVYAAPVNEGKSYVTNRGYYDGALSTEKYKTYKVYYRLAGGWNASEAKGDKMYTVDPERFVCMIDGKAGYEIPTAYYKTTRSYAKNDYAAHLESAGQGMGFIDITAGKDDYGFYIQLEIPDSLNQYYAEKNSTMTVVYEGNWAAGTSAESTFKDMSGCQYPFKVKFVSDNLAETYSVYELVNKWWWNQEWEYKTYTLTDLPSTQYCPSQSQLKSLGYGNNSYFYISPTERYLIRTVTVGSKETYYITYEEYTASITGGGRWASKWKDKDKYVIWFSYNSADAQWQYSSMKF